MQRKIFLGFVCGGIILGLGWFFFWRGTVQFVTPVEAFEILLESGEKVQCETSPCRLRVRAGKAFQGKVVAKGFFPTPFRVKLVPAFRTEIVSLDMKPSPVREKFSLPAFEQIRSERETPFRALKLDVHGPILFDPDGAFAVFGEEQKEALSIFVVNISGDRKILTTIHGTFELLDMHRNFRLQESGIVIPEKKTLFFYDFALRRKQKIWEGDMRRWEQISVGNEGVFVGKELDRWLRFDGKSFQILPEDTLVAAFLDGGFWRLSKTGEVFLGEEKIYKISENISQFYQFWFEKKALYLKGNEEVWEVKFSD
ncbi:hypothetical protein K9L63_00140 [Candidatus Gracilibacteria bacterium]|nr:hypothetical protein [Candidatus Gracilibacteria bacterium]